MGKHYDINIYWSDEDNCFLAEAPDLPGCMADGQTREEALRNVCVVAEEWIAAARAWGRPIPEPKRRSGDENYAHAKSKSCG